MADRHDLIAAILQRIESCRAEAQQVFDKNFDTGGDRRQTRLHFKDLDEDRRRWRKQLTGLGGIPAAVEANAVSPRDPNSEDRPPEPLGTTLNGQVASPPPSFEGSDPLRAKIQDVPPAEVRQAPQAQFPNPDGAVMSLRSSVSTTSALGPGTSDRVEGPNPKPAAGFTIQDFPDDPAWPEPDLGVLRLNRREPPPLPLAIFGPFASWILETSQSAACPPDYVAAALMAVASVLIGNARWAQATPGWCEPPHLWTCVVGDSGDGKSPGSDCIFRDILPEIERRMQGDFPDRLRDWKVAAEQWKLQDEGWRDEVRTAKKNHVPPPRLAQETLPPEPQAPRLRQNDVTIERVATLLASAAPKGLLIVRDEAAGWFGDMSRYNNDGGRAFWVEGYGGRPFRVERQKNPDPINVPHLAVGVYGGMQPQRLVGLLDAPDDGLFSRLVWFWPKPIPFRLGRETPRVTWAIESLDRLRLLELAPASIPGDHPKPIFVPLVPEMLPALEEFAQKMQAEQRISGGLLVSAFGKTRGLALRLSLVLEMLWWCGGDDGMGAPPAQISARAFLAAVTFVESYVMPMAARVYGDAAASTADRDAATLARWIVRAKATEVHVRYLQREVRLPGLKTAEDIHAAAKALIEADWLRPPLRDPKQGHGAPRAAYRVNPVLQHLAAIDPG
jgi:Protein of unknown function (DUF3987)